MKRISLCLLLTSFVITPFAQASNTEGASLDLAQVTYVQATQSQNGSWCFNTQVHHNDQGWEHYADAWQVLDLQGNVLGERKLLHPHDNEQPFTRSLCNVQIKPELQKVVVRAKCNEHGWGDKTVTVNLLSEAGKEFKVIRNNK